MFRWTLSWPTTPNPWISLLTLNTCISKQKPSRARAEDPSACEGTLVLMTAQACSLQGVRGKHREDIPTVAPQVSEGREESPDDRLSPGWWLRGCRCQWGEALHKPQPAFHLPPSRHPMVFYLGNPIFPNVQTRHLITCTWLPTCLGGCRIETRVVMVVFALQVTKLKQEFGDFIKKKMFFPAHAAP